MGFGQAGLYFWYELPGRLRLLGWRFRAMSDPGSKKSARASLLPSTGVVNAGNRGPVWFVMVVALPRFGKHLLSLKSFKKD